MALRIRDTDTLSLIQRRHPVVTKRLQALPPREVVITIITYEEQMRGWLAQIRSTSKLEKLAAVYERFQSAVRALNEIEILPFNADCAQSVRRLQRLRLRIGTADLRIAAIALTRESILVTANTRDFSMIPGLALEDWTVLPN